MITKMIWVRRLFTSSFEYPILGRWSIQYNDKIINRKIDLANEDHCGCCVSVEDKTNVEKAEIEEEYYMPFLY